VWIVVWLVVWFVARVVEEEVVLDVSGMMLKDTGVLARMFVDYHRDAVVVVVADPIASDYSLRATLVTCYLGLPPHRASWSCTVTPLSASRICGMLGFCNSTWVAVHVGCFDCVVVYHFFWAI
jgi:hypothetical protein